MGRSGRSEQGALCLEHALLLVELSRVPCGNLVHIGILLLHEMLGTLVLFIHGAHGGVLECCNCGAGDHRAALGRPGKDVGKMISASVRRQAVSKGVGVGVLEHGETSMAFVHVIVRSVDVAHRACEVFVVVTVIAIPLAVFVFIIARNCSDDLEFAREDHAEGFAANRFFKTREAGTVSPDVDLTMESIGLNLHGAKLTGGQETMAAGSMDMGDGRVYDGRLGRATNLRKVR